MGGYLSMCESLLERGAKLKQHATQTLMAAASCGRLDILKYLVEKLEQSAGTIADLNAALKAAAGAGHLGAVDYLLEQGADADHTGFTAHKIIQGNIVIKTITALGLASLNGHLSVVERLVGKKAHITSSAGPFFGGPKILPVSALHDASRNGYLDIVDYLLKNDAEFDEDISYDMENQLVIQSPLQIAARVGHYLVVRRLLEAGAGVDRSSGGEGSMRPLVFACEGGHLAAAKELLEKGARVDEDAIKAAEKDSPSMVRLLKSYRKDKASLCMYITWLIISCL
ncbi:uncharacterized protein LAJ45_11619 [Morchella importuna]|nr:uncharacterized protein LAJ45_11619 [Morchella importuna]KAH8144395.1 hypothetical protein LAJ45_11619 [Morchella importuna]